MNKWENFYKKNVIEFIKDKNAKILVCGGCTLDRKVFLDLGYKNVIISNLDERMEKEIARFAPFKWERQNAEQLSYENNSFDYVITHASIHHSFLPHKFLTEMFRVAGKGIIAIEARDSLLMRLLEKLNIPQTYEHSAVYYNDGKFGGVNNTDIPNYIYRWTEREIQKTICSFYPYTKNKFFFRYGYAFEGLNELETQNKLLFFVLKIILPFYSIFAKIFPKQQNLFAFIVKKGQIPQALHPWLKFENSKVNFDKKWGERKYK
jgi:ubiquinone/menaquinone biosynthesis C-methylase UbiE